MSEYEQIIQKDITLDEPAKAAPEIRNLSREQAVEYGRRLGEDEATKRREVGSDREQRIRRAMAYAAWDYDGRPASSSEQQKEFGVEGAVVTPSLERALAPERTPKKPR